MRVLVACEFSGVVREAFRKRGHDAWSCDIKPCEDGSPFHLQGDVLPFMCDAWDLVIAHPPCTYLSVSGLHWNGRRPERVKLTEEAARFFMVFTHLCCKWAIENPIGTMSRRYRKPDQIVQPYQFGEDASKATCLWLKGLPLLIHTHVVEPRWVCCGKYLPPELGRYGCPNCLGNKRPLPRWSNQTDSGQNKLPPSKHRAADRSQTYPGIADAMAEQWG
jgi:hypothetical protein